MAHITTSVEYAIHCLLWLVSSDGRALSSRDLADLQGISPSFLAKILPKLEKAGVVVANEGVRGGYRLSRPPEQISFLQIVDAIEGEKPLFDCQEIRDRCAVFDDEPPQWAVTGVCAIHAVMLKAEQAMRAELAANTLADVAGTFERKAPAEFIVQLHDWVSDRIDSRKPGRPPKASKPPS
ncbi:MAG: Rrf2 family transcriptional regulator [Aromatoleum sp.]|jgi:Rrf2 family protein|uniref:RrF2 family transcriptional regulator n=1 Tax=Aromatoleum sp. TaxID=2307007 RepID=UPI002895D357|nr:Rrf2 family transcriptional regulator [Aromatoleum sp.]MDT3671298.1 Rrf2 family transcriptional regulator [Aromatoleum sp.]